MILSALYRFFCDFLEDRHCLCCSAELRHDEYGLCSECVRREITDRGDFLLLSERAERILSEKVPVFGAAALMPYNAGNPSLELVHQLKYANYRSVGVMFGRAMTSKIKSMPLLSQLDYVVPVPLHAKRMASRGYNQAEVIAREVADGLNVALSADNLYRVRDNESQTKVGRANREGNVADLFDLRDVSQFEGKSVLLVDDVLTTGSTIASCCKAIGKSAGVRIFVFVVALAHK